MKNIFLVGALLLSSMVFGEALDTPAKAEAAKKAIENSIFKIEGVNGIGITGCDPRTGKRSLEGPFVHCVEIMTEDEQAYEEVSERYPQGTKVKGAFITIEKVGKIVPQPAATGGNG